MVDIPYKRKEVISDCQLYLGDCLDIMPILGKVDAVVTDPPYGDTSLDWDEQAIKWIEFIQSSQVWSFGSFRYWMAAANKFTACDWRYAQEIIWEKHNGSGFQADRFKRVHEIIVHWYKDKWSDLYRNIQFTNDALNKTVRRLKRPPHLKGIKGSFYTSIDGGPRIMRSVQHAPSCHGYALHPTQKPVRIITPLVLYSVPENGIVLDPFMGSGSTGVACVEVRRKFIGIEIDEKYFDIACERISLAERQGDLFRKSVGVQASVFDVG